MHLARTGVAWCYCLCVRITTEGYIFVALGDIAQNISVSRPGLVTNLPSGYLSGVPGPECVCVYVSMCVQGGVRSNPVAGLSFPPVDVKALNLAKTFKGHLMSVSSLAMHPTKPIVVCSATLGPHHGAPVMWLSIYMYMGVHVCLYVCMGIHLCVHVCLYMYMYMYVYEGHLWTALWARKFCFYRDPT